MSHRSSILPFRAALAALSLWAIAALGLAVGTSALLDTDETYSRRQFPSGRSITTVGLGSSHAVDFYYPVLDPNGFSLHQDMADLKTAEYNLRMAMANSPSVKLVLLAYSPGILDYDFELAGGDPSFRDRWLVNAPFALDVMSPREVQERLFAETAQLGFSSRLVVDRISAIASLNAGESAERCRPNQGGPQGYRFGILGGYPSVAAPADCLPLLPAGDEHAEQIAASLHAEPLLASQNEARITAMAALVRKQGGHLVLVTPPYTHFYVNAPVMRSIWELHDRQTRAMVARTGVTYLDFRNFFPPAAYESENRLFRDNTHLTSAGAALFSRALRMRLERLGLTSKL